MKDTRTVEEKTRDTILQKEVTVKVGDREYNVEPCTEGTLAEGSALISRVPKVDKETDNIILESLAKANSGNNISKVVAMLILGKKEAYKPFCKTYFKIIKIRQNKTKLEELTDYISNNIPFKELNEILNTIISTLDVGFFFAIITSLHEVNMLRETKETTQYGQ